ncbi:MAG: cobalt transporter ApaG [Thaumarchaeota archaeon]|nr:cobalt transporter ApaG [Nitrososphaerota archaeon]
MEERIDSVEGIRQWTGSIPLHYEYTAGVAGERFLRGLAQGKIQAGYCANCKEASLPLRIYCIKCYGGVERSVLVRSAGKVAALTKTQFGQGGERLGEPVAFAYITFEGVTGGLVHRVADGVRVGSSVRPRFKPKRKRTGSILDIEFFERDLRPRTS